MTVWGWVGECGGGVWWFKTSLLKENCLWGRCKKSKKKTNNSAFSATHTYIKLTLVSFFYSFYAPSPYCFFHWNIFAFKKNAYKRAPFRRIDTIWILSLKGRVLINFGKLNQRTIVEIHAFLLGKFFLQKLSR